MSESEAQRDLIVIGASAGGYTPLCELLTPLPLSLKAAICIVIHMALDSPGAYAGLLQDHSSMEVSAVRNAVPLVPGHVYVAPPDRDLLPAGSSQRDSVSIDYHGYADVCARRI